MRRNYKKDVEDAIEALDKECGSAWRDCVDLDKLDMSDYHNCVLGQVYGSYGDAPKHFFTLDGFCGYFNPLKHMRIMRRYALEWRNQLAGITTN